MRPSPLIESIGGRLNDNLKAVAVLNPPYLYPCALYNRSACSLPGFTYEILSTLSLMLNFTLDITVTNKSYFHDLFHQDQHISGSYLADHFNMSASLITISWKHYSNVQFSHSIMYYRKSFLISTPKPKLQFILTLPFDTMTWLCLIISVFIVSGVLSSASYVLNDPKEEMRLSHNLWTIFSSISKPLPTYRVSDHRAHSVLTFMWQAFKTILVSAYGASFISFLMASQSPQIPFNSSTALVQKMERGEMRVVTTSDNVHNPFITITYSNEAVTERIRQAIVRYPMVIVEDIQTALQLVKSNPGLVFSDYNTNLKVWLDSYQICGLTIIEDSDEPVHHLGFAFSKTFPYMESMQRATAEIAASAYIKRLGKKYSPPTVNCTYYEDKSPIQLLSLSMSQMQSIFILLLCGSMLALVLFLIELIKHKYY